MVYRVLSGLGSLLRPSNSLLAGTLFFWLNFLLGPYAYPVDPDALLYLWFCWLLLLIGLIISEIQLCEKTVWRSTTGIVSLRFGRIIKFLSVLTVFAFIVSFYYVIKLYGEIGSFSIADARIALIQHSVSTAAFRDSWVRRLADMFVYSSVTIGLVIAVIYATPPRHMRMLASLMILGPGIWTVMQGGRNPMIFGLGLMLLVAAVRSKNGWTPFTFLAMPKKMILLWVSFSIYLIMVLFIFRDKNPSPDAIFFDLSSIPILGAKVASIKQGYEFLINDFGMTGKALAKLSFYLGHSVTFFSSLWPTSEPGPSYFGGYQMRPVIFVLNFFNLIDWSVKDIIASQEYSGMYPTAVWGMVFDFGYVMTPAIFGFMGIGCGAIYQYAARGGVMARAILPVICLLLFVFWIYPLNWGQADFAVFFFLGVAALRKLHFGAKSPLPRKPGGNRWIHARTSTSSTIVKTDVWS